jgi:hypothetical protein
MLQGESLALPHIVLLGCVMKGSSMMYGGDEKCTHIMIRQPQHHAPTPNLVREGRNASREDKNDIRIQETDI